MTISFPKRKTQKFQIGDVVRFKSMPHYHGSKEFTGIVTGSYGQIYRGHSSHNQYELYVPKWLNPNIKKTAPDMRLPDTFAWAYNCELTFIRELTEEEKIKFIYEFYKIKITL